MASCGLGNKGGGRELLEISWLKQTCLFPRQHPTRTCCGRGQKSSVPPPNIRVHPVSERVRSPALADRWLTGPEPPVDKSSVHQSTPVTWGPLYIGLSPWQHCKKDQGISRKTPMKSRGRLSTFQGMMNESSSEM